MHPGTLPDGLQLSGWLFRTMERLKTAVPALLKTPPPAGRRGGDVPLDHTAVAGQAAGTEHGTCTGPGAGLV